ncbi:MAG TPA: pseudouridine-5'-phosphate glycosidase [Polyangia bacterium]|nr:pseudouridine-5'-phosphate glycosidase [Polyangia bacterium]
MQPPGGRPASAIEVLPEVAQALTRRAPVVALESSVIAHGLPAPHNLEIAHAIEATVRAAGAVPATIAVLGGRVHVGLDQAGLARVAAGGAVKASAADLAVALTRGGDAATTVSAMVALAARAGIAIAATGGIGGVHRGDTLDISHDLVALAQHAVAVVSAGAKSILDLPRTLEALETLGVPVIGFRTAAFPAFYVRSSGLPVEHQLDTPAEVATFLGARWGALGQPGGVLIVQPIPLEQALDARDVEAAITAAQAEASRRRIRGKALTPFLLAELARSTGGRSLAANRALLLANAQVAAEVACAYYPGPASGGAASGGGALQA